MFTYSVVCSIYYISCVCKDTSRTGCREESIEKRAIISASNCCAVEVEEEEEEEEEADAKERAPLVLLLFFSIV